MGLNFLLRTVDWETGTKFNNLKKCFIIFNLSISEVVLGIPTCEFENRQPKPFISSS